MDKGTLLIGMIESVLLLLPIGALIWKASAQARIIIELRNDLEKTDKRVDKLEERNEKAIEEIKNSLSSLTLSFGKIETALEYITKDLKKEGN